VPKEMSSEAGSSVKSQFNGSWTGLEFHRPSCRTDVVLPARAPGRSGVGARRKRAQSALLNLADAVGQLTPPRSWLLAYRSTMRGSPQAWQRLWPAGLEPVDQLPALVKDETPRPASGSALGHLLEIIERIPFNCTPSNPCCGDRPWPSSPTDAAVQTGPAGGAGAPPPIALGDRAPSPRLETSRGSLAWPIDRTVEAAQRHLIVLRVSITRMSGPPISVRPTAARNVGGRRCAGWISPAGPW